MLYPCVDNDLERLLISPSQITACAAKVVIVMHKVELVNSNINVTKITLYVKVTVTMIFYLIISIVKFLRQL